MTEVYWLEQTAADVPAENAWLSASETIRLRGMRVAKRRADWRLGRWTAKCALATYLNLPGHLTALADIEIRPAPTGAPEAFLANQPAIVTISLSHRAGVAACAVTRPGVALGCDLEIIEPRSDAFIADYFTTEERALVAQAPAPDRLMLLALLWSGKESALKALREGLRLDTRCVRVCPIVHGSYQLDSWRPLQVHLTNGQGFHGWWQHTGNLLRTLVSAPSPAPPILLQVPAGHETCNGGYQRA